MTSKNQTIMQRLMKKNRYGKYRRYIEKLDPRQFIRRRPHMYFGGTDKYALQRLYEIVLDDAVASSFLGQCSELTLRIQDNNFLTFDYDDLRIPTEMALFHSKRHHKMDAMFVEFAIPGWRSMDDYKVSGGGHGLGLNVLTPVCSQFNIEICRQNRIWKHTYYGGYARNPMQIYTLTIPKPDGVMFHFQPDFTIFEPNDFDYDWIARRCQEIAYIMPQLTITLIDEREGQVQQDVFHYPDGIQAMVRDLNQGYTARHAILCASKRTQASKKWTHGEHDVIVEVALQYTDSDESIVRAYVNSVLSEEGGTHIDALRHALMGYINGANPHPHSWDDIAKGLTAIINIWHPDPQYESMRDVKLLNPDVFDVVESLLYPLFTDHNLREL